MRLETKAIQQPKKVYIQHGDLPNHEHVQKRTRGKYHRNKAAKRKGESIEQMLGTVNQGAGQST